MNDRFQDAAPWSTNQPAWSPLLVLGGSVVAAVLLISGGLAMLGTEGSSGEPAARSAQSVAPAAARSTTLAAVADLKSLQGATPDERR